jgi:NifU-like protein involved in Fe-S cluster formation
MDDLYREQILEHYKRPRNWTPPLPEIENPTLSTRTTTPCAATSSR